MRPSLRQAASTSGRRRFQFPARYDRVGVFSFLVDCHLRAVPRREEVRVGIAEALTNAVVHGVLRVPKAARDAGDFEGYYDAIHARQVAVDPARTIEVGLAQSAFGVEVTVADGGAGFAWREVAIVPGRGLSLIRLAFDSVRWNERGNTIFLSIAGASL